MVWVCGVGVWCGCVVWVCGMGEWTHVCDVFVTCARSSSEHAGNC